MEREAKPKDFESWVYITYIQLIRAGPLTGSLEFKINHRIFDLHVQILFVAKASRSVAPALCGQRNLIQISQTFFGTQPG